MIWRRLEGFLVGDHEDLRPAFERDMRRRLADGAVRPGDPRLRWNREAWPAFLAILQGGTVGKAVVELGEAA